MHQRNWVGKKRWNISLYNSRWLLAPFYLGTGGCRWLMLLVAFISRTDPCHAPKP